MTDQVSNADLIAEVERRVGAADVTYDYPLPKWWDEGLMRVLAQRLKKSEAEVTRLSGVIHAEGERLGKGVR